MARLDSPLSVTSVTVLGPVEPAGCDGGMIAVTVFSSTGTTLFACCSPIHTSVTPPRFVPVIVTVLP
ncbi:MAG: hypothetical protein LW806_12895, partial [Planctomycetaceae bacterium]|nr:hypothetical protein [Planctomycetaceae bacterium]